MQHLWFCSMDLHSAEGCTAAEQPGTAEGNPLLLNLASRGQTLLQQPSSMGLSLPCVLSLVPVSILYPVIEPFPTTRRVFS